MRLDTRIRRIKAKLPPPRRKGNLLTWYHENGKVLYTISADHKETWYDENGNPEPRKTESADGDDETQSEIAEH